jgi:hypothetical protein
LTAGAAVALLQVSPATRSVNSTTKPAADNAAMARDLLQRYQASLDRLTRIHYRYRVETRYEGGWNPQGIAKFMDVRSGEYFRDRNRASILAKFERLDAPDKLIGNYLNRSILGPDNMQPEETLLFQSWPQRPQNEWYILIDRSPATPIPAIGADSSEMWGFVLGTSASPLTTVLAQATTLSTTSEQTGGRQTHVITAKTPYGTHIIWLDADAGYLPRRIGIHKDATDLEDKLPLGSPPLKSLPNSVHIYPNVAAESWDFTVEIENARLSDVFVPASATSTESRAFVDGQIATRKAVCTREGIDLNPDFAALHAFTLDVPDGTRVIPMEKEKPEDQNYEWRHGHVVEAQRLYGRAIYEDGTPARVAWVAWLDPRDKSSIWSGHIGGEISRADGLFSVTLNPAERDMVTKNFAGQIQIRVRAGTIGEVNLLELGTDPENPPKFTFPKKPPMNSTQPTTR